MNQGKLKTKARNGTFLNTSADLGVSESRQEWDIFSQRDTKCVTLEMINQKTWRGYNTKGRCRASS